MKTSAAELPCPDGTAWMLAAARLAWAGAPSVTSAQREAVRSTTCCAHVGPAFPTGETSSTESPSSKVALSDRLLPAFTWTVFYRSPQMYHYCLLHLLEDTFRSVHVEIDSFRQASHKTEFLYHPRLIL